MYPRCIGVCNGLVGRFQRRRLVYSENRKRPIWATISALAIVVVIGLGAWWTAVAAYEGNVGAMFLRFAISVIGGLYYVVMHRLATGRKLGLRSNTVDLW